MSVRGHYDKVGLLLRDRVRQEVSGIAVTKEHNLNAHISD
jgi:hypothetical protein